MITQPMSRKAFDVQVPPKQQTKSKAQNQAQIVLELRPDGSYAINGQPQELSQLDQALHQIYDQRPAKLLFIKAAPNRKYVDVMQAMRSEERRVGKSVDLGCRRMIKKKIWKEVG